MPLLLYSWWLVTMANATHTSPDCSRRNAPSPNRTEWPFVWYFFALPLFVLRLVRKKELGRKIIFRIYVNYIVKYAKCNRTTKKYYNNMRFDKLTIAQNCNFCDIQFVFNDNVIRENILINPTITVLLFLCFNRTERQ